MIRYLIFSIWLAFHPVHVSLMSIDYARDDRTFNIFLMVYFDDFLLDAGPVTEGDRKLAFPETDEFTRAFLTDYVNEKVRITVNGNPVKAEMTNMNLSDNELRMNLTISATKEVRSINVKNTILTSIYSDQTNMLIVKVNNFEEGVRLTALDTEKTFKIKN